jgi:enamine deaminase RidA (YjgF/YER057c/UK114 family)
MKVILNPGYPSGMRKNISSGSKYEEPIGFSRAVRIGNIIAVAGTGPIPKDGQTIDYSSAYQQTKLCLEIMVAAITEAGGSKEQIIRTRIMLTDISDWQEAARAHGELFSKIRPACTFVEVKGFIDPRWKVETEADCVVISER